MMHYELAQGMYSIDSRVKQLQHVSVAECAIYFWGEGLPATELLETLDDVQVKGVVNAPPGLTNVDRSVPCHWVNEMVCGEELSENGRTRLV